MIGQAITLLVALAVLGAVLRGLSAFTDAARRSSDRRQDIAAVAQVADARSRSTVAQAWDAGARSSLEVRPVVRTARGATSSRSSSSEAAHDATTTTAAVIAATSFDTGASCSFDGGSAGIC
jgi:hypothetical protein